MSLLSMTGHGHGRAAAGGLRIDVEIGSVNRKQLDITLAMPKHLSVLESRMVERIGQAITRGRVTAEVLLRRSERSRVAGVRVDEHLARAYVKALRATARALDLSDDFSGDLLLTLPDVIQYEQPEEDVERVWPTLERALERALIGLRRLRAREGAALEADLRARGRFLSETLEVIAGRSPQVAEHHRKALAQRLKQTGLDFNGSEERLARECALFADRCDITEEATRLRSHFKQFDRLLRSREPAGRTLDFLIQEMMREINTIGAKGNDAVISERVVRFKAELERMREQAQNVE